MRKSTTIIAFDQHPATTVAAVVSRIRGRRRYRSWCGGRRRRRREWFLTTRLAAAVLLRVYAVDISADALKTSSGGEVATTSVETVVFIASYRRLISRKLLRRRFAGTANRWCREQARARR